MRLPLLDEFRTLEWARIEKNMKSFSLSREHNEQDNYQRYYYLEDYFCD